MPALFVNEAVGRPIEWAIGMGTAVLIGVNLLTLAGDKKFERL
ncbi:uncharacterized protein METZ01_LOCUS273282 [marine metagenome]|uniref:Uncharacterized protein n=1 Tax=marine metagenome TaxID=408172 RepID=A0A382K7X1_9ZZZZ